MKHTYNNWNCKIFKQMRLSKKVKSILFNHDKTILINDRYLIYCDTGVIYDTVKAKDIPQYIFNTRDKLLMEDTPKEAINELAF